jgi:large subunit ribosomal protein L4
MKATVYTTEGKEKEKLDLPKGVFDLKWNPDLVHQVLVSMETNKRSKTSSTKDRSEVRGGGKKPWRQKGTGRARHGSNRSPIWVGGGVTFGPNTKVNYDRKVNKKMKTKALFTILSKKMDDNEIIFVDDISFKEPKTSEAKKVIANLSKVKGFENLKTKRNNKAVVAIDENDVASKKSFANFSNIHTDEVRNINPMQLLKYKYLIIENPKKSLEVFSNKLEK